MDILTVSFDDDKWTIENLVDLKETFMHEQRIRLFQAVQHWGRIMEGEELREYSNVKDSSG